MSPLIAPVGVEDATFVEASVAPYASQQEAGMRRVFLRAAVFFVLSVPAATHADNVINRGFFSGPLNVSNNPRNTLPYSVRVALDARGNINVVWADYRCAEAFPNRCTWHLFFSRSIDGGATFSTQKDISYHLDGEALYGPQIAVDGSGNISVVWEDNAAGGWEIFYSRSVDDGVTFTTPKVISNYAGAAVDPELVVDRRGNISVVWQTQSANNWNWNLWFTRSADWGNTFSDPKALCDNTEVCNWPKIAVEPSGSVDLVWAQALCASCEYDVFFSRSTDGGTYFSTSQNLSGSAESLITAPELVVDGAGNLNVVWSKANYASGHANVFLSRSSDHGTTFVSRSLSGDRGRSYFPQVAVDARGAINVFWLDDMLGGIFFSRSVDGGTDFSSPQNVSTAPGGFSATDPYVAVDRRGNLNVVWEDDVTGGIALSRSTDGGSTFSAPEDISNNSSSAFFPQITADASGNINVLWFDESTGIPEIRFARGVTIDSLRNDIASLPKSALGTGSYRRVLLNELAEVEQSLAESDTASAVSRLEELRRHLDGCGASPDKNDWVVDCMEQLKIRRSMDIIVANLSMQSTPNVNVAAGFGSR
jgi:hypothetical protein